MAEDKAEDQVTLELYRLLHNLATAPSNNSIHRVCDRLRNINHEAHDPKIVAIGPLHRAKPHLQGMEHHKIRYLKPLRSSVNSYVTAIRNLEESARECYAAPIALGKDEFVLMLVLDGIFIVDFLRKYDSVHGKHQEADGDDVVFQFAHILNHLLHDLMLSENQIPLFVIKKLFELSSRDDKENFVDLIWPLVYSIELSSEFQVSASLDGHDAPHLLGLVHYAICLPLDDLRSCEFTNMRSAAEMQEAGIIFNKASHSAKGYSFLNITFKNPAMRIPTLVISDDTESCFRNMIAYEHDFPLSRKKYITDYIFFMHCLIQSPRDVKLLRHRGIISSWTGGDEFVYHLIKQLVNEIHISRDFTYAHVALGANKHCKRSWNKWMAILRQNYFDSPWKFISFIAALVLLLLTAAQTMFAILSYRNDMEKKS